MRCDMMERIFKRRLKPFLSVIFILFLSLVCLEAISQEASTIRFRIVTLNPSKSKTQLVPVKVYLPQEIKPDDIVGLGGLSLEFDSQKSLYYVYRDGLVLKPGQTRIFEVELNDIWLIPKKELDSVETKVNILLSAFTGFSHYEEMESLSFRAKEIISEISLSQSDDAVSRSHHIGIYRTNSKNLTKLKQEISEMESLLEVSSGPLSPDVLAKADFKTKLPSKTATWIVIFSLIIFIGLLSAVFFFTWYRQSRSAESVITEARKVSFGEGEKKEGH